VRSQVRFNRVPEKVSEKVLGAKPSQVQQVPEKVAEKVPVQGQVRFQHVQQGFQRLASQHASERFVKINVAAVCWGYHRSLFFCSFSMLGQKSGDQFPSRHPLQKVYPATFLGHRSAAESLGPEAEPPQIGRMISWPNCSGQLLSPAEDSTEGTRVLIHEP